MTEKSVGKTDQPGDQLFISREEPVAVGEAGRCRSLTPVTTDATQRDCPQAPISMAAAGPLAESREGVRLTVALVGPGLVGLELLKQLDTHAGPRSRLATERGLEVRVVAVARSGRMCRRGWAEAGESAVAWIERALLSNGGDANGDTTTEVTDLTAAANHAVAVAEAERGAHPVVVDCTASSAVPDAVPALLARGVHVVSANKRFPADTPAETVMAAREAARRAGSFLLHEAACGAGLPVLRTLDELRATGDRILRVEGVLSGTLSFLFNGWDGARPFSEAVADAKASGFTEPDPRDDLSGTDVARKLVVLGRAAGAAKLELSDVIVESLVPAGACRNAPDAASFLAAFAADPAGDAALAERRASAAAAGKVLRFGGIADVINGSYSCRLAEYDSNHPFASLSNADNVVVFVTERYPASSPLVVRGPGAGAAVTAAGVFGDLVRLSGHLGGWR